MSGLGVLNAKNATQALLKSSQSKENEITLNVGICGATQKYEIGSLLEISEINYENKTYSLNERDAKTITCINKEATDDKDEIVDMESYGFYKATKGMKNAYIFKVVSDYFEPQTVTKERTKDLIFKQIDEIMKRVK